MVRSREVTSGMVGLRELGGTRVPRSGESAAATGSAPSPAAIFTVAPGSASAAATAASTLGIIPPAITPSASREAAPAPSRLGMRASPWRTWGTSERKSTALAPHAAAMGATAMSALTLRKTSVSPGRGVTVATTGT